MSEMNINRIYGEFYIKLTGQDHIHKSPSIVSNNITWFMELNERKEGDDTVIDAAINCIYKSQKPWTCDAACRINIRSYPNKRRINKVMIPEYRFCENCSSSDKIEIVRSSELAEHSQDGVLTIEIRLTMSPIFYRIFKNHLTGAKFDLKPTVLELEGAYTSPDTVINGSIWNVCIDKFNDKLRVHVRNKHPKINVNWSWAVECSITLYSLPERTPSITKTIEHEFSLGVESWGLDGFITWAMLTNPANNYIRSDYVLFECVLNVGAPTPLWSTTNFCTGPIRSFCVICTEENLHPTATECGHIFCYHCIRQSVQDNRKCPSCNKVAKLDDIRRIYFQ